MCECENHVYTHMMRIQSAWMVYRIIYWSELGYRHDDRHDSNRNVSNHILTKDNDDLAIIDCLNIYANSYLLIHYTIWHPFHNKI
jgi:hypothetical protein